MEEWHPVLSFGRQGMCCYPSRDESTNPGRATHLFGALNEAVIGLQNWNQSECVNGDCDGVLIWDDGAPFQYELLGIEVRADEKELCFFVEKGANRLKTNGCRSLNDGAFICEFACSGNWTYQMNNCGSEVVPIEFSKVDNKYYRLMSNRISDWPDAKSACSIQGTTLPILETPEDVNALSNVARFLTDKEVPLGLKGQTAVPCQGDACIGKLIWENGESFQNLANFSSVSFSTGMLNPPLEMGLKLDHHGALTLMRYDVDNFVCEFRCNIISTTTASTTASTIPITLSTTTSTITVITIPTTISTTILTTTPTTMMEFESASTPVMESTTETKPSTPPSEVRDSRWMTVDLPEAFVSNFKEWIAIDNAGKGCQTVCQKACVIGITRCFASEQDTPTSNGDNLKRCICRMTSIRRFPGQICGPQMIGCLRKPNPTNPKAKPPIGIWVDGLNTEIEDNP